MEDMSAIVLEQADRLFQQHVNKEILSAADNGEWPAALWAALEDAGLPLAMVPEFAGGVGLATADVANLIRRAAFHSVPLPLAETMLANRLWTDAGGEPLEGAVTLGPTNPMRIVSRLRHRQRLAAERCRPPCALGIAGDRLDLRARCRRHRLAGPRPAPSGAASNKRRRNVAYEPRDETFASTMSNWPAKTFARRRPIWPKTA